MCTFGVKFFFLQDLPLTVKYFHFQSEFARVCCRGGSEVMFSVNDRLAATGTLSPDEPAKIPTDHVFTMTGIANQSMSVLSTKPLPGVNYLLQDCKLSHFVSASISTLITDVK